MLVECLTSDDIVTVSDKSSSKDRRRDKGKTLRPHFVEHEACWDLNVRGAVGETALHLCVLYSTTEAFRDISKILLRTFPKLSLDYYEGDEYYGRRSDNYLIKWQSLNQPTNQPFNQSVSEIATTIKRGEQQRSKNKNMLSLKQQRLRFEHVALRYAGTPVTLPSYHVVRTYSSKYI